MIISGTGRNSSSWQRISYAMKQDATCAVIEYEPISCTRTCCDVFYCGNYDTDPRNKSMVRC